MTLNLNPTVQSLILHMYTMFEDSSLYSSWENWDKNLALKDRKLTNKETNKSKESDSQSHNTTTHCPYVYYVSRFLLRTIVPEKIVTQKILRITELRCYGQTKSSIAPLFQSGVIITKQNRKQNRQLLFSWSYCLRSYTHGHNRTCNTQALQ